jgi:hypothetical protein
LRVLADASEALGIEGRRDVRVYTSDVPLNRFVDLVQPESETVRHLEQSARLVIANPMGSPVELAELRLSLTEWAANDSRLKEPLDLVSVSKKLSTVGSVGLQALEYLKSGSAPPAGWASRQRQVLDEIEKPDAEVRLAAVRPVRMLVDAVARMQGDK